MAVTADRLLSGIKRRIIMPASQPLMSNQDILQMADDCMRTKLVPLLKSVSQNYFVTQEVDPLVINQDRYSIPKRAVGRTLRDLKLMDNATPIPNRGDMALIALEDAHMYRAGTLPQGFYFIDDQICIIPLPQVNNYYLEKYYELPPGQLILLTDAAVVQSISSTSVTVFSAPTTITTGSHVDFIQSYSGCRTLDPLDSVVTNVAGNTYNFASSDDIPVDLQVGDYVSPEGFSPVLQIPDEAFPYLETCTSMRILKSLGDFEGAGRLEKDEDDEAKNLRMILEPRITGENTKIINRRGLLRAYRGRFLTGRYFS